MCVYEVHHATRYGLLLDSAGVPHPLLLLCQGAEQTLLDNYPEELDIVEEASTCFVIDKLGQVARMTRRQT